MSGARPSTTPLGAIAQSGERVLCKHEVVGSIPSCSTIASAVRGGRSRDRQPGPPARRQPSATLKFATGLVGWRIASPFGRRGVFLDIVKSECVRPSGRDARQAKPGARPAPTGRLHPERREAHSGLMMGSLTASRPGQVRKKA